jgi:hypothetical protein
VPTQICSDSELARDRRAPLAAERRHERRHRRHDSVHGLIENNRAFFAL